MESGLTYLSEIASLIVAIIAVVSVISTKRIAKKREVSARIEGTNKGVIRGKSEQSKHIASELHDNIGGRLSVAKMQLTGIRQKYLNVKPSESQIDEISNGLAHLDKILDSLVYDVRTISHSLDIFSYDTRGLIPALETLIEGIQDYAPFSVKFIQHGFKSRLDANQESALFRVTQELLNNILKHASARNVVVQLVKSSHRLTLLVEDDGVGFDPNKVLSTGASFGLRNIQKRVEKMKGIISIDSSKGKGTTVVVELNLKEDE